MSDERGGGRRWGMYLIGIGILLVCALFLTHVVWSAGAGRSLNRQVVAIRASGEPIEFADFATTQPISDEDNGAIDLRDAYKSIDTKSEAWERFYNQTLDLPLVEKEVKAIRAVVAANPKAFEGIDAAMTRKGVDWRVAMTSPSLNVLVPYLTETRQLSYLVSCRAKLAFTDGDHAAAVRDFERLRFLSQATEQPPTLLISHLVAVGIMGLVTDDIQKMAPTLKIGDGPGEVSKKQVAELIAKLLDDKAERASLIRAFHYERAFQLDTVRCIADGTLNIQQLSGARTGMGSAPSAAASALSFAVKPVALEDGGIMLRYDTQLLEAIKKSPDWPTFKSIQPGLPPEINNARHLVLRMLLPSLERSVETNLRCAGERRAAAVALACRWYALEHGGTMPAKMEDLIPKYLPSAPLDPYASAQPLKYIGPATTRPIVYSVGDNGKDEGGSEVPLYAARPVSNKWQMRDFVTHLTPQPRQEPPAEDSPDDGTEVDNAANAIYPPETMERVRQAATQAAAAATQAVAVPATQPAR